MIEAPIGVAAVREASHTTRVQPKTLTEIGTSRRGADRGAGRVLTTVVVVVTTTTTVNRPQRGDGQATRRMDGTVITVITIFVIIVMTLLIEGIADAPPVRAAEAGHQEGIQTSRRHDPSPIYQHHQQDYNKRSVHPPTPIDCAP